MRVLRMLFPALLCLALRGQAADFAADRIGAGQPDSLPVLLMMDEGQTPFKFRLTGKDDSVSAIITGGPKLCTVALRPEDQAALLLKALEATVEPQPGVPVVKVLTQATRNAPPQLCTFLVDHPCPALLRRLIAISRLAVYVVVRGDTFERVMSERLGGKHTREAVLEVNPGLNPELLVPGQEIRIPPPLARQSESAPALNGSSGSPANDKSTPAPAGEHMGER